MNVIDKLPNAPKPLPAKAFFATINVMVGNKQSTTKGMEPNQIGNPSLMALLVFFNLNKILTMGTNQIAKVMRIT